MITARMISNTSPGMAPGGARKPNTSTASPSPPHKPMPTPPARAPMAIAASRTANSRISVSVMMVPQASESVLGGELQPQVVAAAAVDVLANAVKNFAAQHDAL